MVAKETGRKSSFGARVKALRIKIGGSQRDLAKASLLTQAMISRIEAGKVDRLKPHRMRMLALALGVSVDYLSGEVNGITPADFLKADPTAASIVEGYRDLSLVGRQRVASYVRNELLWEKEQKESELEELEQEHLAQKNRDIDNARAELRDGKLKFPDAVEIEDEE